MYFLNVGVEGVSNQMESPTFDERYRGGWTLVVWIRSVALSIDQNGRLEDCAGFYHRL